MQTSRLTEAAFIAAITLAVPTSQMLGGVVRLAPSGSQPQEHGVDGIAQADHHGVLTGHGGRHIGGVHGIAHDRGNTLVRGEFRRIASKDGDLMSRGQQGQGHRASGLAGRAENNDFQNMPPDV